MNDKKKIKIVKNVNEWTKSSYISNLINVVINLLILSGVYMLFNGKGSENTTLNWSIASLGFFLIFIPYTTLLVPIGIIRDSRKACIDGKWKGESVSDIRTINNPWRRISIEALIIGFGTALIIILIFWLFGMNLLNQVSAMIIGFLATLATTTIIFWRHIPNELNSFWTKYSEKKFKKEPFGRYFLHHYVIPWVLVLIYINLVLGIRSYYDHVLFGVPRDLISFAFFDLLATGLVIEIWMYSVSFEQVRMDIKLGRVEKGGKVLTRVALILILISVPVIVSIVIFIIFTILGMQTLLVIEPTITLSLAGAMIGLFGLYMGAWVARISKK